MEIRGLVFQRAVWTGRAGNGVVDVGCVCRGEIEGEKMEIPPTVHADRRSLNILALSVE